MEKEDNHQRAKATASGGYGSLRSQGRQSRKLKLALLRMGYLAAQRLQLLANRGRRITFDLAIALDQRGAERCQHRAAAILAAGLRFDRGLPADRVDLVDQVPGALVGHL